MNAFVLAGGQSTRMGRDKALVEIGGRPLIVHALDRLRGLGLAPRICGARPDLSRWAGCVPDRFPHAGPLAGIEAALAASDTDFNLFLPVDMPAMPSEFLGWMMARAERSRAVATVPSCGGRPQPLCAVYDRALAGGLRGALESGHYKVMAGVISAAASLAEPIDAFDVESVAAALPPGVWPASPPLRHWFRNLNTPADLQSATDAFAFAPGANDRNPIS